MTPNFRSLPNSLFAIFWVIVLIILGSALDGAIVGLCAGLLVAFIAWLSGSQNAREVLLMCWLYVGIIWSIAMVARALAKWYHLYADARMKQRLEELK